MDPFPLICSDPLWNHTAVWNTTNPNLTHCIRKSLCLWIPAGFLLVFSLVEIHSKKVFDTGQKTVTLLFSIKLFTLLLSTLFGAAEAYLVLWRPQRPLPHAELIYFAVLAFVYILNSLLIIRDRKYSVLTSPLQYIFWLLMTLFYVPTMKIAIEEIVGLGSENVPIQDGQFIVPVLQCLQMACYLLMVIWNCLADRVSGDDRNSEATSSFPSTLTFHWLNGLFWKGRSSLSVDMYPGVSRSVTIHEILRKFGKTTAAMGPGEEVNILKLLVKTFGGSLLSGIAIKLSSDCLLFVVPQILRRVIRVVEVEDFAWKGYFWAVGLFAFSMMQITMVNQYFRKMHRVGFKMRTAVITAIYKKGLKLSAKAKSKYTTGEITNLMSIDSQRFVEVMPFINVMWAAPIQFTLATYFLHDLVGVSAFAGLSVILVCLPINFLSGRYGKIIQLRQLEAKDERMLALNEILQGAKVLKLYAWEIPFMNKVLTIREKELNCLKGNAIVWANMSVTFSVCVSLVTLVSFATYVWIDPAENVLTAEKIFACLAIFNLIRIPMFLFPTFFMETIKLLISTKRINEFLNAEELAENKIGENLEDDSNAIEIRSATFDWGEMRNGKATLENISMSVPRGALVAVLGKVGAGKSSLLSAILGDMKLTSGSCNLSGSVAYAPQQAWIQNMTVKDNILFGKEMDGPKYDNVLDCCALLDDLEILPGGDETEIGENGVNLSGGQKQRLNLARAVYNEAEIVLMDDPLSAVDAHVGEHLFTNVIGPQGLLADKTRVLVTHNVTFLSQMDHIILLEEGQVALSGTYKEVRESARFNEFIKQVQSLAEEEEGAKKNGKVSKNKNGRRKLKSAKEGTAAASEAERAQKSKIIENEAMAVGKVNLSHMLYFIKKFRVSFFSVIVLMFLVAEAAHIYGIVVLSYWSDKVGDIGVLTMEQHIRFIRNFGILVAIQCVLDYIREYGIMRGCVTVSKNLHKAALESVMHAPMQFFDTNPVGRTVNRFSSDLELVDSKIPMRLTDFIWCGISVVFKLVVISYNTPAFLIFLLPIAIWLYLLKGYYSSTKSQLKRIESVNKSPIFAKFTESIMGTSVIRAYRQSGRFIRENTEMVSRHLTCSYINEMGARWLSLRVEYTGNVVILLTGLLTIYYRETLSAGMAAMTLALAVMILDELGWCVKILAELEADSVAIERLREYEDLKREDDWFTKDKGGSGALSTDWPSDGQIEFKNYSTRYREDLDDILKELNLCIKNGEKLGICGRTGAYYFFREMFVFAAAYKHNIQRKLSCNH